MSETSPGFREIQHFRTNALALVAVAAVVCAVAGAGVAALTGAGPGTAAVMLVVLGGVGFLLLFGQLGTEVRADGLYVRMFPLMRERCLHWHEIRSVEPRTYRPLLEYGGWGLRCGRGGSRAYNVRGNRGVQLELTSGERLLIGSQRADELARAIEEMRARA